jgi:hypothetical protein
VLRARAEVPPEWEKEYDHNWDCHNDCEWQISAVKHWPKLIYVGASLQKGEGTALLDLPRSGNVVKNEERRTLHLRAVMFSNESHFTSAVRAPKEWVYYDGQNKDDKGFGVCKTFAEANCMLENIPNFNLVGAIYEVMEFEQPRTGTAE